MKLKYIFSNFICPLALLFLPFAAFAQDNLKPGLHAGIEITKPLLMAAVLAEPLVKYHTGSVAVFSLGYGYCSMRRDSIYENIAYRNKGQYIKPGIELMLPGNVVSFGAGYIFSGYTETGRTLLRGPYFGNKEIGYRRRLQTHGIEININLYLKATSRLIVFVNARTNFVTTRVAGGDISDVPVFYAPGAGRIGEVPKSDKVQSGGISAGLLFRLTTNKVKAEVK